MSLSSFSQPRVVAARQRDLVHTHAARARLRAVWVACCLALALSAPGCGDSDPAEQGGGAAGGGQAGGGAAGGGAAGGGQGGGGLEDGSSPVVADGSVPSGSDASIQTSLDGGMPIPVEPPKPIPDASITGKPLGNAYASTEYNLERPQALVTAYGVLTAGSGDSTRLLVNYLRAGDAGAEALYGAADNLDGGLVWQKPPAQPNSFTIGVSAASALMFVSNPFKYILEARIPNPLNPASVFRIYLESEQTVWSATFSSDYENITTGALYGIVTRVEAEHRPLAIGSFECLAVCENIGACTAGISTLSGLLDCNGAQLDADVNGDGTNDGYRLIVSFTSRRVEPPTN